MERKDNDCQGDENVFESIDFLTSSESDGANTAGEASEENHPITKDTNDLLELIATCGRENVHSILNIGYVRNYDGSGHLITVAKKVGLEKAVITTSHSEHGGGCTSSTKSYTHNINPDFKDEWNVATTGLKKAASAFPDGREDNCK